MKRAPTDPARRGDRSGSPPGGGDAEWEAPAARVGLRELKKARNRAQVLEVAARLFALRGFDRVTVEEICAEAEISPRTFFRYFHSKDELVFADIEERLDVLLQQLRAEPDDAEALGALERAVLALALEMERRPDAMTWAYQLMRDSPALVPTNLHVLRTWEDDLVEEMARRLGAEAGTQDPSTQDPDLPGGSMGAPSPSFGAHLAVSEALTALRVAAQAWVEGSAPPPTVTMARALGSLFGGLRSLLSGEAGPGRSGKDARGAGR
jgi:AcrR family transcriptional regulator